MAGEQTYEQVFGVAPRSTGYNYAGTGTPLPPQQAAIYDELRAAGGLDPRAQPGTPRLPRAQIDAADTPKPGDYYVPAGGGGVQQQPMSYEEAFAPPAQADMPVSQGLGFEKGLLKAPTNVLNWASPQGMLADQFNPWATFAHGLAALGNADVRQREQTAQPGKMGQFAGEMIGSSPLMALPGGPILQGAATSIVNTDHPTDALRVAEDAAGGAAGGYIGSKLGGLATAGLGKIAPKLSPDVQALIDHGVPLTPGQYMGGGVKRLEDAATSVPVLGDAIRTAQRRSMEGFNRAVAGRALAPIGEAMPGNVNVGRDGVGYVQDRLGAAYDAIAPKLRADLDQTFVQNVGALRSKIAPLALDYLPTFDHVMQTEILPRVGRETGALDGAAAKDAQTSIGLQIRRFEGSSDPKIQAVVDGLKGVQAELSGSLERNSPPEVAAQLGKINEGYANFVRMQTAAASAGTEKAGGLFTPSQLGRAVRSGDASVRKGQYARGEALMQDLAGAGDRVLPSSVPDSGTALRYLVSEAPMLIGFGSESANFLPHLAGAVGLAGVAGLPYTTAGQAAAQKLAQIKPWRAIPLKELLSHAGANAPRYGGLLAPSYEAARSLLPPA